MASDAAVVASIALQYSVPLDVIRGALMRDPRGKPSGPLGVVLDRLAVDEGTAWEAATPSVTSVVLHAPITEVGVWTTALRTVRRGPWDRSWHLPEGVSRFYLLH